MRLLLFTTKLPHHFPQSVFFILSIRTQILSVIALLMEIFREYFEFPQQKIEKVKA